MPCRVQLGCWEDGLGGRAMPMAVEEGAKGLFMPKNEDS